MTNADKNHHKKTTKLPFIFKSFQHPDGQQNTNRSGEDEGRQQGRKTERRRAAAPAH